MTSRRLFTASLSAFLLPYHARIEDRRGARLLLWTVMTIAVVGFLITLLPMMGDPRLWDDFSVRIYGLTVVWLAGCLVIMRRGYWRLAALVLIVFLTVIIGIASIPLEVFQLNYTYFLLLPIVLSSTLLSYAKTFLIGALAVIEIGLVAWISPFLTPIPTLEVLYTPGSFVVMMTAVIIMLTWYRDRREGDSRAELAASEARYRLLAENAADMVSVNGIDTRYTFVSPSSMLLLGYSPEELLGRSPFDFVHPEDTARVFEGEKLSEAVRTIDQFTITVRFRRKSGEYVWLEVVSRVRRDPASGAPIEIVASARDISERKRAEREAQQRTRLETMLDRERNMSEAKSHFIRLISHEFRTPLSIIRSSSDLLLRYDDPLWRASRLEKIDQIQQQVTALEGMLSESTLMLRSQDDGLSVRPQIFDVRAMCGELHRHFSQSVAPDHRFVLEAQGDLAAVRGDPQLMNYILTNLMGNAAKYSPAGSQIELTVAREDAALVFTVCDEGIGIAPEDRDRLFEAFYRGGNTHTTNGIGLGLKIVGDCVRLYGGTVTFESELGKGTCFSVRLPILT